MNVFTSISIANPLFKDFKTYRKMTSFLSSFNSLHYIDLLLHDGFIIDKEIDTKELEECICSHEVRNDQL